MILFAAALGKPLIFFQGNRGAVLSHFLTNSRWQSFTREIMPAASSPIFPERSFSLPPPGGFLVSRSAFVVT